MTKEERQAKIMWLMRYRIAEIRIDRMKAERKDDGLSKAFADIFGSASR